ncbi:hypothetical protein OG21DRAFT_1506026 [Imleria badia]|nr:hypothetical protein OG21DRAFT_1506026 [Imleria badia]
MFSPIPTPSASRTDASSGLYVPIHRRTPSSCTSSPSSSSRALSPIPSTHSIPGVYTPAELLSLAHSPLVVPLSAVHADALRAVAPEIVQTRKQRKAMAWHARLPSGSGTRTRTQAHRRAASRGSHTTSEEEEDRAVSWRRTRLIYSIRQ